MQQHDTIAILDFGGQYAHLITNRIRRLGVHAVIEDHDVTADQLQHYKGIILSGGPQSVNAEGAVLADPDLFELGIPVLGICYGHQVTNKILGGKISPGHTKEYGKTKLHIDSPKGIFKNISAESLNVWMSHWDEVTEIPVGFQVLAHTDINDFAAVGNLEKNIFGIQFHPEVTHTQMGMEILKNFVEITEAEKTWDTSHYLPSISEAVQQQVQETGRKVFMLVSGGVDSVVAFTLLNKVLGQENVVGLLVDTGFMRQGEVEEVMTALKALDVSNLHVADAKQEFYKALEGVSDPEEKRGIIGKKFIDVQKRMVKELNLNADDFLLGQGTIYPDTIESGSTKNADKIKTHHNRVPEIDSLIEQGLVIEPLQELYKDEVRQLGEALGLPHHLVWRHPFPGPGLAIRMLCTPHEPKPLQKIDEEQSAAREYLSGLGLNGLILPIQSVGVQGDARTYRHPITIWPASSSSESEGATTEGNWQDHWNAEKLHDISTTLTNRFESINRVVFCLSGTIDSAELIPDCYLTAERVHKIQAADKIVMDSIMSFDDQEKSIWQCPTVLLPLSINSKDSSNDPQEGILIRPVSSIDAMTADANIINTEALTDMVKKLTALEPKPSAIFYDLTNKPPGTIEWE